jgi:DNA-binding NarL/FixJ family response regulator
MTNMNCFETIVHFKKNWPDMMVVFLSMHEEECYFKRSMNLGADGFIKKDAPIEELKNALVKLTNKQMDFAA